MLNPGDVLTDSVYDYSVVLIDGFEKNRTIVQTTIVFLYNKEPRVFTHKDINAYDDNPSKYRLIQPEDYINVFNMIFIPGWKHETI